VNIYRPGSERPSAAFFEELPGLLELLVPYSCPVVVGGDLNVHVNDADSTDARQLTSLLSSFDMVQHVCSLTHRSGNVLDLVITFSDRAPADVTVDPHSVISDHALVTCSLPVTVDAPPLTERLVRGWRRVKRQRLASLLTTSPLCATPPASTTDVDHLFNTYHTVLLEIAN